MNSQQRWYAKLKADPERYAEYRRKQSERLRADPKRYAEHLRKQREFNNRHYAEVMADSEAHAKHLHEMRERARVYRESRREELSKKEMERRAANPDRYNRMIRERRAANPEKKRKWARKDYETHVDGYKRRARERRLRKANASGYHTEAEWQALCSYYMDQCLCCGEIPDQLTRDHIVPLVKGGPDDISNIQPLCLRCNISKGAKIIDYRA